MQPREFDIGEYTHTQKKGKDMMYSIVIIELQDGDCESETLSEPGACWIDSWGLFACL